MSLERRQRALGMLVAGMRIKDVAHRFGVNSNTISRLRSRYQATGEVRDRQRTGRPRKNDVTSRPIFGANVKTESVHVGTKASVTTLQHV